MKGATIAVVPSSDINLKDWVRVNIIPNILQDNWTFSPKSRFASMPFQEAIRCGGGESDDYGRYSPCQWFVVRTKRYTLLWQILIGWHVGEDPSTIFYVFSVQLAHIGAEGEGDNRYLIPAGHHSDPFNARVIMSICAPGSRREAGSKQ